MSSQYEPKPTSLYGVDFRSRLECRWAIFLTELKIEWRYEPRLWKLGPDHAVWYLPDFYLPQAGVWAEVKPGPLDRDALAKVKLLAAASRQPVVCLVGWPRLTEQMGYLPSGDSVKFRWKGNIQKAVARAQTYPFDYSTPSKITLRLRDA